MRRFVTIPMWTTFALMLLVPGARAGLLHQVPDEAWDAAQQAIGDTPPAPAPAPAPAPPTGDSPGHAAHLPEEGGSAPAPAASADPPGQGAWLHYDFVPGERTIWYEDFADDKAGDFPHRFGLEQGHFEVVDLKGTHALRTVEGGRLTIRLPENLPQRFTVELTYRCGDDHPVRFRTDSEDRPAQDACEFGASWSRAFVAWAGREAHPSHAHAHAPGTTWSHARFTIDGTDARAYIEGERVVDIPGVNIPRTNVIRLQLPGGSAGDPVLVASLRIAECGRKLFDVLAASGRVTTHGILFDTGSDRILAESTPTLEEIGGMLKAHPELELSIEGHTDNVGSDASNQALSEKRAASVKAYLVANFGVDAARLRSRGWGAGKPVAANATAEGRQVNRRVELVKL